MCRGEGCPTRMVWEDFIEKAVHGVNVYKLLIIVLSAQQTLQKCG